MYKVPFRQVYCDTLKSWFKSTLWIFLVMKVFPHAHDFGCDDFCLKYKEDHSVMGEQLEFIVNDVLKERACV